jgi:hypothetical protein
MNNKAVAKLQLQINQVCRSDGRNRTKTGKEV